jgi:hypothetical protein
MTKAYKRVIRNSNVIFVASQAIQRIHASGVPNPSVTKESGNR